MPRKRKSNPLPANETPEARFERLAIPRVTRVLRGLDSIGKLSSPRYRSSPEHVQNMRDRITAAVIDAFAQFERKKKTITFSL